MLRSTSGQHWSIISCVAGQYPPHPQYHPQYPPQVCPHYHHLTSPHTAAPAERVTSTTQRNPILRGQPRQRAKILQRDHPRHHLRVKMTPKIQEMLLKRI